MSDLIRRDSDALERTEDDAKSKIRIWLRGMFESDPDIRQILECAALVSDARPLLLESLDDEENDPNLPEVLDELLEELKHQKATKPGLYLVDAKTGKSVIQLREGAIYQPPDYIGADGIKRKAQPVLHPGIAAPLTLLAHEAGKFTLARENLGSSKALTAIFDPNSIIRDAEARLRVMGCEVGPIDSGTVEEIEIGREYYDPFQSKNDQFHRHSAFGAILAKKVADGMGNARKCELSSAVLEKNSKQRWYRITIKRA